MHNFWDITDEHERMLDTIMFFKVGGHSYQAAQKMGCDGHEVRTLQALAYLFLHAQNLSILGALFFYLGSQPKKLRID